MAFSPKGEYLTLIEGQARLWRIRFQLHRLAGRREDRLLFDYQRSLARDFGFVDDGNHNLAVEQFMQQYYRTVIELNRLNEMLLQLFQEAILLRDQLGPPVAINRRFQAVGGFLEVTHPDVFRHNPVALLEIFHLLQTHPEIRGVRASTIRLIRERRHLIDDRIRADLRARSFFMEIMRHPKGPAEALSRMNRYGVLAAYLPAFANIVGRMQYDLFHVYTVDEHTLRLLRHLCRVRRSRGRWRVPLPRQRRPGDPQAGAPVSGGTLSTISPRAVAATIPSLAPATPGTSASATSCPSSTAAWSPGWSKSTWSCP
jgi:[protein-PII] uridylyltransferase